MKGTGAMGLKASATRRRTKQEIREEKLVEAVRKKEIEDKLKELDQLREVQQQNQVRKLMFQSCCLVPSS